MVFLDLDNFKAVVDHYGHLQGSKVLGEVARVLNSELGPDDSLVRYGGDEFIILLPHRGKAEALVLTRRLRERLNQTSFLAGEGLDIRVTASFGIATLPADAKDREELLAMADKAMFSSKGRGKDRIMVGRDLTPAEAGGWFGWQNLRLSVFICGGALHDPPPGPVRHKGQNPQGRGRPGTG